MRRTDLGLGWKLDDARPDLARSSRFRLDSQTHAGVRGFSTGFGFPARSGEIVGVRGFRPDMARSSVCVVSGYPVNLPDLSFSVNLPDLSFPCR
jgi:hypothetical protein